VIRLPSSQACTEAVSKLRQHLVQPGGQAGGDHFHGVLAAHGQQVLAVQGRLDVAPAQQGGDLLLDVLGLAFFQHQHGALAAQKFAIWSGTSGLVTLSTSVGMSSSPNASARPNCCSARTSVFVRPPCTIRPRSSCFPGSSSLRPCSTM
jgi:hypothetical protein